MVSLGPKFAIPLKMPNGIPIYRVPISLNTAGSLLIQLTPTTMVSKWTEMGLFVFIPTDPASAMVLTLMLQVELESGSTTITQSNENLLLVSIHPNDFCIHYIATFLHRFLIVNIVGL